MVDGRDQRPDGRRSRGETTDELPLRTGILLPLVDAVARIKVSVHLKLLAGFLAGALLMAAMAALSLVVINQMNQQVGNLTRLQEKMDRTRQMEYLVTAQSHFRAMALLTNDAANNTKIANAKQKLTAHLNAVEGMSRPELAGFFQQTREINSRFDTSSAKTLTLYESGNIAEALNVHLKEEHPISHELEEASRKMQAEATNEMTAARAAFESNRGLLTTTVLAVSGASLVLALFLGFVLSWTFIRPVRRVNAALEHIAEGDFTQRVEVPNRDEFGALTRNLNSTSEQLAGLYRKLQLELATRQRTERELVTSSARLKQSNQELVHFASVAAHDLQEPLRKVQTFGDRLKAKCGDALNEQGRDYLDGMQNASQRMGTLINDLLSYSRVTTKAQPFVPVNLSQVAQEVVSDLEVRIGEVGGRVEVGELPTIDADPLQMRQLLQNLIGNALKYRRPEEAPIVKVQAQMLGGDMALAEDGASGSELCQITVEDNGIGFDEKYLGRLFVIFQRLHNRSEYEGTGVGLAICRKIVERHGGTITARSTPGAGSTFIATLLVRHDGQEEGSLSEHATEESDNNTHGG